jgi:hypothetical protein
LSTGGGFIGGGESHESVRNAAKKMVAVAAECQPHTHATSEYPLPQKQGEVLFYLVTDSGIHCGCFKRGLEQLSLPIIET